MRLGQLRFCGNLSGLPIDEDERREKVLTEMGLRMVRFGNDEVMRNRTETVGKNQRRDS